MLGILREGLSVGGGDPAGGGGGSDFCQSEVKNLGVPALGDEDVCRLDVAVHNALGMSCVQRIGNLDGETDQHIGLYRNPSDAMLQRQAVEKLHGDECLAVLLADVIKSADVGMIQRGGGLGLALKAGERLRVAGQVFGKEFQRDETMQPGVLPLIDHAHTAATEFFDNTVMRNGLADH